MRELVGPQFPSVMIGVGLFVLWGFGDEAVWKRLWIDVAGMITSSISVPYKGAARYRTDDVILLDDGRRQVYTAGSTDASLVRGMPVGTKVIKHRWELGYTVKGTWIAFPGYVYFPILSGAACLAGIGVVHTLGARCGGGAESLTGAIWFDLRHRPRPRLPLRQAFGRLILGAHRSCCFSGSICATTSRRSHRYPRRDAQAWISGVICL
jgi:hypothetical protein